MTEIERKHEDRLIRSAFPLLNDDIVYIDNSATTQKPDCVLRAMRNYYECSNANPLRGLYRLSVDATEAYESARQKVAVFINAPEPDEIVFTRNASESLNLIAYSYGMNFIRGGDEIIVSILEHHSNLLPWQQVAKATGAKLTYLDCEQDGTLTPEMLEKIISPATKLVALTHVSNALGCENDLKSFARIAHEHGALIVADGSQSVPHMPVDVQALDVDFLVFSGHKMLAPMGIGVLWARRGLLEKMPPFMYGGEMIESVRRDGATYASVPHKFEAGTVNAGGAVGLGAAIDYINSIGFDVICRRENDLTEMAFEGMKRIPHVNIMGSADASNHHGILSFTIDGVHPHDVAAVFDDAGIDVRAGHHCAQPLLAHLGVRATTRASFSFYNTREEVRRFLDCLNGIRKQMGYDE